MKDSIKGPGAGKAPLGDKEKVDKEIQNERMVRNKGLAVKIKRHPAVFL
jgi:hypothetical protein